MALKNKTRADITNNERTREFGRKRESQDDKAWKKNPKAGKVTPGGPPTGTGIKRNK